MSPPAFRFHAKRIFLTFPQCGDLSRERVRDFLVETHSVQHYLVARESHRDGNYHIHAYGEWASAFSTRDVRCFDVDGQHPNIQPVRSTRRVLEYIQKSDSDVLGNVESLSGGRVHYGSILGEATNRDDFLARVRERYPRDYVLSNGRLQEFCDRAYPEPRVQYEPRWTEFSLPDELRRWELSMKEEVGKLARAGGAPAPSLLVNISSHAYCLDRPRGLILIGGTRLGKTEWARSLGRHMYWCGQFNLDDWDDGAEYAVLDDFGGFKFFPHWKGWLGGQREFVVTDKYRKKKTVKWGKPAIWLCNPEDDPRGDLSMGARLWLDGNVDVITLFSPLFSR